MAASRAVLLGLLILILHGAVLGLVNELVKLLTG